MQLSFRFSNSSVYNAHLAPLSKFLKILKRFYLFIFREGKGVRKREEHHCVVASCLPATQACALDWELNQRPFGPQAGAQSTEPHQPGPVCLNAYGEPTVTGILNFFLTVNIVE